MKMQINKIKQQGVALAIGMILLLTVSIIGVTSMKSAMLQDRMAAGLKNKELSDAAALSMLSAAEHWLYAYFMIGNGTVLTTDSCDFCVEARSSEATSFRVEKSLDTGGFTSPEGVSINDMYGGILAAEPRFIIEALDDVDAGAGSSTRFADTVGETAAGSQGGGGGAGSPLEEPWKLFRVVSKATDNSGYMFSAYESVYSVKPR